MLGQEPALRRALTDPSAASEAKSSLARGVFGDKLGAGAVDVAATAAGARWSSTGDFVDAIEQLGALALVIDSEKANQLSDLEDELFRFGRIVSGDPELRDAITNRSRPGRSTGKTWCAACLGDKVSAQRGEPRRPGRRLAAPLVRAGARGVPEAGRPSGSSAWSPSFARRSTSTPTSASGSRQHSPPSTAGTSSSTCLSIPTFSAASASSSVTT